MSGYADSFVTMRQTSEMFKLRTVNQALSTPQAANNVIFHSANCFGKQKYLAQFNRLAFQSVVDTR